MINLRKNQEIKDNTITEDMLAPGAVDLSSDKVKGILSADKLPQGISIYFDEELGMYLI